MAVKINPCKLCGSTYHTAFKCPKNPEAVAKAKTTKQRMLDKQRLKATQKPPKAVKPKKQPTKRKKTETRSQLVKRLDKVFSEYIRRSNSIDGIATCVTCGKQDEWKNLQNGHYMSRGHYPTRWDETNCHVQCVSCNVFKKGNYTEYAIFMINRYGADYLDELRQKANSGDKIPTPVIREMIADYKQKCLTL